MNSGIFGFAMLVIICIISSDYSRAITFWNGPIVYNASHEDRVIKIYFDQKMTFSVFLDGGGSIRASGDGFKTNDSKNLEKYSFILLNNDKENHIKSVEILGDVDKKITKQIWVIDTDIVCVISERVYWKIVVLDTHDPSDGSNL